MRLLQLFGMQRGLQIQLTYNLLFCLRVRGVSSVTARVFGITFVSRLLPGRVVLSLNTDPDQSTGFDYTPCINNVDSHPTQYFMHWCSYNPKFRNKGPHTLETAFGKSILSQVLNKTGIKQVECPNAETVLES